MNEYGTLKEKWKRLKEEGSEGYCFDYDRLAPGKFCVHIRDSGGGPCRPTVETTGFFDSEKDALGYYRFVEIPRILHWNTFFRGIEEVGSPQYKPY